MGDLVERPHLGVPKRRQLRQFFACRQALAEALLHLRDRTRLQLIRPDFDDHRRAPHGFGWTLAAERMVVTSSPAPISGNADRCHCEERIATRNLHPYSYL